VAGAPSAPLEDGAFVARYLEGLVREWRRDLDARSEALRESTLGQRQLRSFRKTRSTIRPLVRKAREGALAADVVEHVKRIALLCQRREYRRAVEQYYRLAIGNSPWPIGVTGSGIHDRASRNRLATDSVAHILNDEETREYVVAVRQLIAYAQRRFPNAQPSRMVDYTPKPGKV
jgi:pre-mRNA-splicing factor 18